MPHREGGPPLQALEGHRLIESGGGLHYSAMDPSCPFDVDASASRHRRARATPSPEAPALGPKPTLGDCRPFRLSEALRSGPSPAGAGDGAPLKSPRLSKLAQSPKTRSPTPPPPGLRKRPAGPASPPPPRVVYSGGVVVEASASASGSPGDLVNEANTKLIDFEWPPGESLPEGAGSPQPRGLRLRPFSRAPWLTIYVPLSAPAADRERLARAALSAAKSDLAPSFLECVGGPELGGAGSGAGGGAGGGAGAP